MSEQVTVYADAERDDVADTMAELENVGIAYTLVDLTQDENALQHVEELGFTQTPIVEAGTTSWAGFRPDLIHERRPGQPLHLSPSAARAHLGCCRPGGVAARPRSRVRLRCARHACRDRSLDARTASGCGAGLHRGSRSCRRRD